jgi:predicted transcriptional regulator
MTTSDLEIATAVVSVYVKNNAVPMAGLPQLIADIHAAFVKLQSQPRPIERLVPAVPVASSVADDHIVCLEDGKKLRSLRRHLMSCHGLNPEEYRARWGLARDYPMVDREHSARMSELAKTRNLRRKSNVGAAR